MSKTIPCEHDVVCDDDHCDEFTAATCPNRGVEGVPDGMQEVFAKFGPENERSCDWWRTMAEPWRSIADALGVR